MADAKAPKQGKRKALHPWAFWCQKAREDLDDATDLLEAAKRRIQQGGGTGRSHYGICFHAQQAVEKALKGALAFEGKAAAYTHDLAMIRARLAEECQGWGFLPDADQVEYDDLEEYAVNSRYPGFYRTTTLEKAQCLLDFADNVVKLVDAEIQRKKRVQIGSRAK